LISLIQTAEGSLNETHSILQRMRELAVQSSNDTNTTSDRNELQQEVNQLAKEVARIGNNTEFNTQNLLDGSFEGTFQIGANEGQNITVEVSDMRSFELGIAGDTDVEIAASSVTSASGGFTSGATYSVQGNETDGYELVDSDGTVVADSSGGETFNSTSTGDSITFADAVTDGEVTMNSDATGATGTAEIDNKGLEAGDYTLDGDNLLDANGEVVATNTAASGVAASFENADGEVVLSTSTTSDNLVDGQTIKVGGTDISSQETADAAITTINNAIESVSAERSKLGAVQNRLDHTINNLGTSSENLTAAESRIRDVDYAEAA
jgi:flagellin